MMMNLKLTQKKMKSKIYKKSNISNETIFRNNWKIIAAGGLFQIQTIGSGILCQKHCLKRFGILM